MVEARNYPHFKQNIECDIDEDEDGNEIYTTLEDEELGEAVFQKFMEELDAAGEEDED